jgi:hypothetical protein
VASTWSPPPNPTYSDTLQAYIEKIRRSGIKAIHRKPTTQSLLNMHIRKVLLRLKRNTDIIIKPSDKNLGLVILNRSTYKEMCLVHLSDTSTYQPITNHQTEYKHTWAKLQRILTEAGKYYADTNRTKLTHTAKSLCQLRNSGNLRPAQFYCLQKIHKQQHPIPGRPIASAPSTITYHTSIYLNNLLQPILASIPTICKSSSDALRSLTSQSFPPTSILFTADVKALYPSIPTALGLDSIKSILELSHQFTTIRINFIIKLMQWVLTHNFICFEDNIYLQIEGTAMGTPMAPTYAIIFMYAIERKHLRQALFYVRYIDDIFAIFTSVTHITEFVDKFNSIVPERLQLESIVYGQESIFLDLKFKLDNGKLAYEIYQKPYNTFAYIPTSSDHHPSVFRSFVLEELKRYYRNCSDFSKFTASANAFKIRLQNRGYQSSIFDSAYHVLLTRHLPMNLADGCSSCGRPDASHTLEQQQQLLQQQATMPRVHRRSNDRHVRRREIRQPILLINMPILNHSINWRQLTMIPDNLRNTLAFHLAYRSSHIIIARSSPQTLGKLYISSKF